MDDSPSPPNFTKRERDCFRCALDGLSAKETSRALGISEFTIRGHWDRIREKLGADTMRQAVRIYRDRYAHDPLDLRGGQPGSIGPTSSAEAFANLPADAGPASSVRDVASEHGDVDGVGLDPSWFRPLLMAISSRDPGALSYPLRWMLIGVAVVVFGVAMMAMSAVGALAYGLITAIRDAIS